MSAIGEVLLLGVVWLHKRREFDVGAFFLSFFGVAGKLALLSSDKTHQCHMIS